VMKNGEDLEINIHGFRPKPQGDDIATLVSNYFKWDVMNMTRKNSIFRNAAMWLMWDTDMTITEIQRFFGFKSHNSVYRGLEVARAEMQINKNYKDDVLYLKSIL